MAAPLEVTDADVTAQPEAVPRGVSRKDIQGRSRGRIVRGQTLSLRKREFVDAARSLGARGPYILFREILPNLVAPILVYSTLIIPTNILFGDGLRDALDPRAR